MWIEKIVGSLDDKKQYRQYRARVKSLPDGYREACAALERYLLHFGPSGNSTSLLAMLDDLADLFEQSIAAETPVRDIVGNDPVEFAETFLANYPGGSWIAKERARLTSAIDHTTTTGSKP